MYKITTYLPEIKLVGIKARTNNAAEINPSTAKIPLTLQKYFQNSIVEKISYRKNPGTTFCVYTEYETDYTGHYTYFVGEEVTSIDDVSKELTSLTIPSQNYTKFTNEAGPMPQVCINMWQKIWQMTSIELGGERSYIADFEIYDQRAIDLKNSVLDIYIGIKKPA